MFCQTRLIIFLSTMILHAALAMDQAETKKAFYISPTGNDRNPGTIQQPFLTLEKARDRIRELKKSSKRSTDGVTVFLREGRYFRTDVFCLNPDDSGEDHTPIVYCPFPGEKAVLIGGKRVMNWKLLDENVKGLKPELKGKMYVATVPKGWKFHFLYINGTPQKLSRSHNSEEWFQWNKLKKVGKVGANGQMLVFPPGELDNLEGMDGQIEIDLMPVNYWNTISVLKDIDPQNATASRHSKNPTTFWSDSFQEGNYNLLNSITFIDEPGEWAIDSNTGNVYLLPAPGTIDPEDEIIAPVLYRFIHIKGDEAKQRLVKNIHFQGIEFRYTDRMPEDIWPDEWIKRQAELPDAMIYIEHARDIVIRDCKFFNSGSYGIALEEFSQQITILTNEMGFMGCGGVLLQGYGPGLKDVNKNNLISQNYIYQTGMGGYLHSAAITLYQSGSNEISFNIIKNMPYVGVQICGANWDAYGKKEQSPYPNIDDPGAVDSYGNAAAQYATRWQDFPNGRDSEFTRESFKTYLHSTNNKVHHNIILDYLEKLSDGAPLYSWSSGMGNLFYKNLMKRRMIALDGQKWVFALYMDDNVDGAVLSNNIIWGQADPEHFFYNKGENLWSENEQRFPEKPSGFDALVDEIVSQGMAKGGWHGALLQEIISAIKQ